MNLKKNGQVFTSKFVGTGPSSYKKKNLPVRGLTKLEKHWSIASSVLSEVRTLLYIQSTCSSVFNLLAGFSLDRAFFDPGTFSTKLAADEVTNGQVFTEYFRPPPPPPTNVPY